MIPVHYAGLAADMTALHAVAQASRPEGGGRRRTRAAHHPRAGALVGTLASDATVFSFYANKTITTGEGGMLVTRDEALAKRAQVMRLHGMNRDAFDRFTAKVPSWYYEVVAPGFKYNLTDIAAALGIHQLQAGAAPSSQARGQLAAPTDEALAGLPLLLPPRPPPAGEKHAWHLYVVRLADGAGIGRDRFIERLFDAGIGCSVHYIPLHLHPTGASATASSPAMFPHSQHAYERMVSLPLYTRMTEADVGACDRRGAPCARRLNRRGGQAPVRPARRLRGALLLLSPLLLLLVALCRCKLDSPRPGVLPPGTRRPAPRVGCRSASTSSAPWRDGAGGGLPLTVGADPRITKASAPGCAARRVDELPQLIDVLQGDDEPRRPAPRGAALRGALPAGAARTRAARVRPGITDPVSLDYIDEAALLAAAADPEREYIERILPVPRCSGRRLRRTRHAGHRPGRADGAPRRVAGQARLASDPLIHDRADEPRLRFWHRLDAVLARLRPHREPLSLVVDAAVVASPAGTSPTCSAWASNAGSAHARPTTAGCCWAWWRSTWWPSRLLLKVPQSMWRFSGFGEIKRLTVRRLRAGGRAQRRWR